MSDRGVVGALIASGAWRAVKYLTPTQVVRATRTRRGRKFDRKRIEITLTIGKPNYLERDRIREFKRAGEPFPVKEIQLQPLPKGKKS